MATPSSASFGLPKSARCVASTFDTKSRFLVGTQSLRDENSLFLLEYEEDSNSLASKAVYAHPHEVWDLAPAPHDPALVFTVFNDASGERYFARFYCCFALLFRYLFVRMFKPVFDRRRRARRVPVANEWVRATRTPVILGLLMIYSVFCQFDCALDSSFKFDHVHRTTGLEQIVALPTGSSSFQRVLWRPGGQSICSTELSGSLRLWSLEQACVEAGRECLSAVATCVVRC